MSKQSLLLVDGDTRSLRVLEVSLRKAGFMVTAALSVQDALDKLELHAPDLIISETTFPDGDGFELRRRVRATPEWSEIPFIFLTAEAAIENKIRGLELGVDDYLTKPIYIKEIVTRINILLQKRQRTRFEERRDGRTRFAGRVQDMPVVDVIQTIEISRKSGVIQFVGERGRQAAIYFRDGRVIDAEAGALQGEDAVYRLLTWSEGEFEVVFRTVRRREVITVSSQGLLMEGMRRLDEWSRLFEQLPPLTHRFEVDTIELATRLGDVPDDNNRILRLFDGKRTLLEVIDASDVGDLECLQAISRLYFEELLIDLDHGRTPKTSKSMAAASDPEAPTPIEEVASGPVAMGQDAPAPSRTSSKRLGSQPSAPVRAPVRASSGAEDDELRFDEGDASGSEASAGIGNARANSGASADAGGAVSATTGAVRANSESRSAVEAGDAATAGAVRAHSESRSAVEVGDAVEVRGARAASDANAATSTALDGGKSAPRDGGGAVVARDGASPSPAVAQRDGGASAEDAGAEARIGGSVGAKHGSSAEGGAQAAGEQRVGAGRAGGEQRMGAGGAGGEQRAGEGAVRGGDASDDANARPVVARTVSGRPIFDTDAIIAQRLAAAGYTDDDDEPAEPVSEAAVESEAFEDDLALAQEPPARDDEPGPLAGGYRPSSLRLIDEAVAAAQAIEPSLFDEARGQVRGDVEGTSRAGVDSEDVDGGISASAARGRSESGSGRSESGSGRSESGSGRSEGGSGRSESGSGRSESGSGRSASGSGSKAGGVSSATGDGAKAEARAEVAHATGSNGVGATGAKNGHASTERASEGDGARREGSEPSIRLTAAESEESGLRMIGSLGRDRAEASGELAAAGQTRPLRSETARELVTILPRRITREMPALSLEQSQELAAQLPKPTPTSPVLTSKPSAAPAVEPAPVTSRVLTGSGVRAATPSQRLLRMAKPGKGPGLGAVLLLVLAAVLAGAAVYLRFSKPKTASKDVHGASERPTAAGHAVGSSDASGKVQEATQTPAPVPSAPTPATAESNRFAPPVTEVAVGSAAAGEKRDNGAPAGKDATLRPADRAAEAKALYDRAREAMDESNVQRALELVEQSLKLRKTARTYLLRAQAQQRLDRVEDALASVDAARVISPELSAVYETRGKILWAARRRDEARGSFEKFLEMEPNGPRAAAVRRLMSEPR